MGDYDSEPNMDDLDVRQAEPTSETPHFDAIFSRYDSGTG